MRGPQGGQPHPAPRAGAQAARASAQPCSACLSQAPARQPLRGRAWLWAPAAPPPPHPIPAAPRALGGLAGSGACSSLNLEAADGAPAQASAGESEQKGKPTRVSTADFHSSSRSFESRPTERRTASPPGCPPGFCLEETPPGTNMAAKLCPICGRGPPCAHRPRCRGGEWGGEVVWLSGAQCRPLGGPQARELVRPPPTHGTRLQPPRGLPGLAASPALPRAVLAPCLRGPGAGRTWARLPGCAPPWHTARGARVVSGSSSALPSGQCVTVGGRPGGSEAPRYE